MVREFAVWALVGFAAAAVWVVPLINWLYRLQITINHQQMPSGVNDEWMKIHAKDSGTPSNGGVLIWLTVPAVLLLAFSQVPLMKAAALIMLLVGAYGFIDALIDVATRKNTAFREFSNSLEWRVIKFVLAVLVNVGVALIVVNVAGVKNVALFGWTLSFDSIAGIGSLALISTLFSYSTEIVDGIDGLSSGMFMITLIGLVLLMFAYPANFLTSATTTATAIAGVLEGVLIVYLYFNIPPARFYMGATGALPIGPVLLLLGLYGNVLPGLLVLMAPYFLDLFTSFLQLLSLRFLGRRIFRIAPIHHHFESVGWSGPKVVMRFWLGNWTVVLFAIVVQLFLR